MTWDGPSHWKVRPKGKPCGDGTMMGIIFGELRTWKKVRKWSFRRCNASGKIIWPGQEAWWAIVTVRHPFDEAITGKREGGMYKAAWLVEDQYLIEKLKGNI